MTFPSLLFGGVFFTSQVGIIVYDEDSPDLTLEAKEEFRIAVKERNRRLKIQKKAL